MKYFVPIVSLTVFIIFFAGCKKDISHPTTIIGTWELRQAQNGMTPAITYPPGNENILKFSDSGYAKYVNGNLIKSGHYQLIRDTSVEAEVGLVVPSGQFTNRIIFDGDSLSHKTFIEVSDNKLTLLSGFFPLDGGSNMLYERINNNR
jgi:hypothetical protein